jgi:chromosome segregation ATPase
LHVRENEGACEAAIASNAQGVVQMQATLAAAQTERAQWEARYTEAVAMAEATQEEIRALRTELAHKERRKNPV